MYWCFYLHWSRDSVSPVCGIFLHIMKRVTHVLIWLYDWLITLMASSIAGSRDHLPFIWCTVSYYLVSISSCYRAAAVYLCGSAALASPGAAATSWPPAAAEFRTRSRAGGLLVWIWAYKLYHTDSVVVNIILGIQAMKMMMEIMIKVIFLFIIFISLVINNRPVVAGAVL